MTKYYCDCCGEEIDINNEINKTAIDKRAISTIKISNIHENREDMKMLCKKCTAKLEEYLKTLS